MDKKSSKLKDVVSNSMLCDLPDISKIMNQKILKAYLDEGWDAITKNYKSGEVSFSGKERSNNKNILELKNHFDSLLPADKTLALEFLGSIRKYTVETFFNCAKAALNTKTGNLNEYFAAGSTNITSDYDVSVSGPDGNEIMWLMFKKFVKKFGSSLPYSFDSNLYSGPLYIHTSENGTKISVKPPGLLFPRLDYGSRNFTLVPNNIDDVNEELSWACIKLLSIFETHIKDKHQSLENILIRSRTYKDHLMLECSNAENKYAELVDFLKSQSFNDDTKKIIKNYYLQYMSQKVCQNFVYYGKSKFSPKDTIGDKEQQNFFYYSNKANYYASEAYYTSSAVNTIVVENQLGHDLELKSRSPDIRKKIYLTAAIENLGDMYNHMLHEKGNTKRTIVKYSKYLYRIYYALGKSGNLEEAKKATKINKIVIPFRKTYNIKMMDKLKAWDVIDYIEGETIPEYANKILKKMLKNFELKLSEKVKAKRQGNNKQLVTTGKTLKLNTRFSGSGKRRTLKKRRKRRRKKRR
ncbi:MAG: hypothetical protein CXT73_02340 [Methanobacteriota archaeon]|nr:MAG: hypothetical protein CXT73_02340 [Euryarchaeota archaeon]